MGIVLLLESWIVLVAFIVNLVFLLVMSFTSNYYKQITAKGKGKVYNIMWIIVIILVSAVLMMYNVNCTIKGNCIEFAYLLTGIVVLFTIVNIGWGIHNAIKYKGNKPLN